MRRSFSETTVLTVLTLTLFHIHRWDARLLRNSCGFSHDSLLVSSNILRSVQVEALASFAYQENLKESSTFIFC